MATRPSCFAELARTSEDGTPLFPLLGGPKVGPLWVRLLAYPGGATISSLEVVPVAVDVQVRKVTEYLGVTETAGLDLEDVRATIQDDLGSGRGGARGRWPRRPRGHAWRPRPGALVLRQVGLHVLSASGQEDADLAGVRGVPVRRLLNCAGPGIPARGRHVRGPNRSAPRYSSWNR